MSEVELLKRQIQREKAARKAAEQILEAKALELHTANESLKKLNESLEDQIQIRTKDLQESETKYRNVVEQATDIIYSTDEEGYFTFINPTGADAFGYSLNEIIGKRYIDFVLEEHRPTLFEYYTKFRDEGTANDYFEFPIRSKSGETHWIGQNVNRVEKADGSFYYNAVARDITLRKTAEKELERAQKALAQSEVKYRSVLENLELGLMEVDNDGIIRRVYDRFCKMTGYTKEELIGQDAIKTLLVEEFEEVLRTQDRNRQNRQAGVYEVQIRRKDGKKIWVIISGAPFYNADGEVIGSLGIHFDISDRKLLESNLKIAREKAEQAQKAEQQFLANMSHEIRTPLNAIIGMSHLLQDTLLDGKQSEYVNILSDSASLLKGLVSDILDISKIDAGMADRNDIIFDLEAMAKRLIKTFEQRAADRGLQLSATFEGLDNCMVVSDHQWLNQILINLISNSIKFTHQGQVHLSIKRLGSTNQEVIFYFEVSDTGIGMDSQEMKNIFNSFKQANAKVRREYGGTGLGLSIATRLVALLGGTLEVTSKKDVGSRFYFSLPLKISVEKPQPINTIEDYIIPQVATAKLLVVEDNIMNQRYISSLLNKWKVSFDLVENGQEAVDHFQVNHYDLVFMDLSMPIMDGYEATNIIRSLPKGNIPIVALTASTFLSKKELALQSGMTDFLAKPFTPQELFLIIQKYLRPSETPTQHAITNNSTAMIDDTILQSLYHGDVEYALEMFQTYQQSITPELETLRATLHQKDVDSVRKQVHKIKPMFTMVGLPQISKQCEELEPIFATLTAGQVQERVFNIIKAAELAAPFVATEIKRLKAMENKSK